LEEQEGDEVEESGNGRCLSELRVFAGRGEERGIEGGREGRARGEGRTDLIV
jgi:hypothetical protein